MASTVGVQQLITGFKFTIQEIKLISCTAANT